MALKSHTRIFQQFLSCSLMTMESGPEVRTLQEESRTQATGLQKTRGSSTTSGQDYEVALCSLIFLRALRIASDFFLVCNDALAGKFDDVVLFYRLKGDQDHRYRAIFLQAKHKEKCTQKKLTKSNPFRLGDYLESFKEIRNHWKQPARIQSQIIELQEVSLILYTNTGCLIDDAARDVTDFPEVQHLQNFLNTGGRLLRISETQRLGLPQGPDALDFNGHLLLFTEQMNARSADRYLEEELCKVLRLTSPDVASILNSELKRAVKAWWSEEGTRSYLTVDSEEWNKVLQMQIRRLNTDTLFLDRQLNLGFTVAGLEELDVVHRRRKVSWISVSGKYQANAVRSRLLRAQRNSLVLDVKHLEDHCEEVEALWRKSVCPILVLDISNYSQEEESLLLMSLQMAVQNDPGRYLVVIAKEKPTSDGWNVIEPSATWSVLDLPTRERLLSMRVEIQSNAMELHDIVGLYISDVMSDEVINSVIACKTLIKLGQAMPAPLEYYVPRCLQRISYKTIKFDTLQNENILIFSGNKFSMAKFTFSSNVKTVWASDIKKRDKIEGPIFVEGIISDSEIRNLCSRFCVRGCNGEIGNKEFTGDVTEFIPVTWLCEEKFVVVEGLPGVGKSSLVTAMCYSVKEKFPESWVLRVDMGRHIDLIKGTDFRNSCDIKEILLKSLSKDQHILERNLLEHSLTVTGNVFLFLDAFDEISPEFTTRCCELLKGIAHNFRFRQMVVTTRPFTTKDVQEALETEAFTLPVFSRNEQTLFLEQFSVAKGKNVNKMLFFSLRQSAGPVIEIPLLCKMAAEVLLYRQVLSLLQSKNPWRRVLLYKLFVEQSVKDRLAEKLGLEVSMPGVKALLESNKRQHLQNLQGLAVRKLVPVKKLSNLYVSKEKPEEKLGLVVNIGETVDFEHQTFAEYFLGCWLYEHWRKCPQQLLRDVLLQDGFEFVAATLSWLLLEEFPLHVAVAQGDEVAVRALLSSGTTDRGGRSALHVAAMTQDDNRQVWELLVASGEDMDKEDDVLGRSAVKYAEVSRNWEFIELILEKGSSLSNLKLITKENSAKEIVLQIINKDLSSLCRYIVRLHKRLCHYKFKDKGDTLLHIAAANNSIRVMKVLIEMRHKINVRNKRGMTPLLEASRLCHMDAVRLLIESGADPDIKNDNGYTAMTWAARERHLEVVKLLIRNGADPNIKNIYGQSALTLAASQGHLELVTLLIESGADPNIKNAYGVTAMTLAASKGHGEVVKLLIENGADPNIKNEDGETALTLAGRLGHLAVIKLLIDNGADRNIKNEDGETALTLAASAGHLEIVELLIEIVTDPTIKSINGPSALTLAAFQGQLEVVTLLLENGADPNLKNVYGETAMTLAASEGHLEVVKLLIENGAYPNIKNAYGETALTEAASGGHLEVVKLLIENGAHPNIKNAYGETAMTLVTSEGHLKVVTLLIESGADANIKNAYGETALTLAASQGHPEVVRLLIENGAHPNIKSKHGESALTLAARKGHLEVVKLLIENGADPNIKNKYGVTPLIASEGHLEVIKLLIENGADPNIKNGDGETALSLAARVGNLEVVKLLIENGGDPNMKNNSGYTAFMQKAFNRESVSDSWRRKKRDCVLQ